MRSMRGFILSTMLFALALPAAAQNRTAPLLKRIAGKEPGLDALALGRLLQADGLFGAYELMGKTSVVSLGLEFYRQRKKVGVSQSRANIRSADVLLSTAGEFTLQMVDMDLVKLANSKAGHWRMVVHLKAIGPVRAKTKLVGAAPVDVSKSVFRKVVARGFFQPSAGDSQKAPLFWLASHSPGRPQRPLARAATLIELLENNKNHDFIIGSLYFFVDEDERLELLVKAQGGSIERDEQLKERPIVGVNLERANVGKEILKELGNVKSLRDLSLKFAAVTDADLLELANLKSLQRLNLYGTKVSDEGMKHIAGIHNLRYLDIGRANVTDKGLRELAGLKNLPVLDLQGTKVTDLGMKVLTGFKSLHTLDLQDTSVGDDGIREIANHLNLQTLSLASTKVTDVGVKPLARMNKLRVLGLNGTKVTESGLREIATLHGLEALELGETELSDKGLKELAGLKNLRQLGLNGTKVTDAGLKELAGLSNLHTLAINETKVTDAGLPHLLSLGNLQLLDLTGTQVNGGVAELAKLGKALPKCTIVWKDAQLGPKTFVAPTDAPNIFNRALLLTSLKVMPGRIKAGAIVDFQFGLENTFNRELRVPWNKRYKGTVVGARQHWVERLGNDAEISKFGGTRVGRRYAAGGYVISAPDVIPAEHVIPLQSTLATMNFPPGQYRYYVEVQSMDGKRMQTSSVEFELAR